MGNWPWCDPLEGGLAEDRFRYSLTTLTVPQRCLGMARRRVGRGGRSVNHTYQLCVVLWDTEHFVPCATFLKMFTSGFFFFCFCKKGK